MEQTTASFEKKNNKTKLINIGLYSLLALIGLSIWLFVLLYVAQQRLAALGEIRHQSDMLANRLHQSSDDLTRLVRTYAVTGNKKFEQQFWDVLAIRDGVKPRPLHYERIYWDFLSVENGKPPYPLGKATPLVKLMKEAGFTEREFTLLAEAQRNSDQLVELEQVAMNAMNGITTGGSEEIPNDTSGQQVALRILFGERYHQAKIEIMRHINTFLEELDNRTFKEFTHQAFKLKIFLFSEIFTFTLIICVVAFLMGKSKQYHAGMVSTLNSTVKARTTELLKTNEALTNEIANRKKMEETLLRNQKLASVGQVSASVAHELRNPLTAIQNSSYYLSKVLKGSDDKVKKHLTIIRDTVLLSNNIITSLLDLTREKSLSLVKSDVNRAVKNVLTDFKKVEGITINTQLDENLPAIPLDLIQILSVFKNIISNSVQAMPKGGSLDIKTEVRGDFVEVEFKDTGTGISKENIQKIYEPLFTTKAKGIGLGLALVKTIIDEHNGSISVESEIGKGTTFTLKLPVIKEVVS